MVRASKYRSRKGRQQIRSVGSSERSKYVAAALLVFTVVFWGAAPIFVALMALYSLTKSVGTESSWATGIAMLLVAVPSGAITWVEFVKFSSDSEHSKWTNKMLFYGLVCVINFFVALLYLPALFFAS